LHRRETLKGSVALQDCPDAGNAQIVSLFREMNQRPPMKKHLLSSSIIAASLFLCIGCGKKEPAGTPESQARGRELFVSQRCANCHGLDGGGTSNAPQLKDADEHFTDLQLVEYLRNPSAYIKNDPRLLARQSEFAALMPSFSSLDRDDLDALARYVLSL
jgi:mono/diheme cytochrome c family protein